MSALPPDLARLRDTIRRHAENYGLVFPETHFEVLDHAALNEVAAFGGFPVRYPHWRFGMGYEGLRQGYAYGLQKIYELVINSDPCYAYLMRSNARIDQKIVMAHVYGHADFFRNNLWFAPTDRKMVDGMANHGSRIRGYVERYGVERVERWVDDALSLENLIDPYALYGPAPRTDTREGPDAAEDEARTVAERVPRLRSPSEYMEPYLNPPEVIERERRLLAEAVRRKRRFPPEPRRDVLGFLAEHAPVATWQRDILSIVRDEALYFAPQAMTKIMNEGWATYWHSTILTERVLEDDELVDYAEAHSGTLASRPGVLNPYKLGVELWRHIEDRWNRGRFGPEWQACEDPGVRRAWDTRAGLGRRKIFEVRRAYNDVTFLEEFLTEEFVEDQRLFVYRRDDEGKPIVDTRDFAQVKETLLRDLTNGGQPVLEVLDANHGNRGALLLRHRWDGLDLKVDDARLTMEALHRVWTRPVHVATRLDDRPSLLGFDGTKHEVEEVDEGLLISGPVEDTP